ncbi:hypothetical protein DL764_002854 [Monosporascus ibericus]|uniref:Uncharacterized protein n=1 Tax=Monosporascus ibericus TaxID=155417 RepID=A0A4Q4TIS1_9PEZI|nr:hypothetical protein DL764_002854 [Monosporascus ibericus]
MEKLYDNPSKAQADHVDGPLEDSRPKTSPTREPRRASQRSDQAGEAHPALVGLGLTLYVTFDGEEPTRVPYAEENGEDGDLGPAQIRKLPAALRQMAQVIPADGSTSRGKDPRRKRWPLDARRFTGYRRTGPPQAQSPSSPPTRVRDPRRPMQLFTTPTPPAAASHHYPMGSETLLDRHELGGGRPRANSFRGDRESGAEDDSVMRGILSVTDEDFKRASNARSS